MGGGESTFVVVSITVEQSGYYSCRASNDHSAVVSEPALVIVKGRLRKKIAVRILNNNNNKLTDTKLIQVYCKQ